MRWRLLTKIIFCTVFFAASFAHAIKLRDLEERLKKNPNQTKVREAIAKEYLRQKKCDKVIELLAAYSNEVTVPSLIRLSDCYAAIKDYPNQIQTLQLYQQREPDIYRPYLLLGVAYHSNKKIDPAIENLRRAIELSPKMRPSYDELLKIMMEKDDKFESRAVVAQMVRQFGKRPELLNLQCKLYSEGGFLAEAEQSCKEALARSKDVPENHIYLAQSLFDQGRKQAAENVFKQAAKQFPNSEMVQFSTGEFYFNAKSYAPAARYLEQGVKIKPDSARSLLGLALSLIELRQYAQALPNFEKACKLDKTHEALNEWRSAASKLRSIATEYKISEEYDRKIAMCQ
jgi:tetratricopeptide (TPR) repeat protein